MSSEFSLKQENSVSCSVCLCVRDSGFWANWALWPNCPEANLPRTEWGWRMRRTKSTLESSGERLHRLLLWCKVLNDVVISVKICESLKIDIRPLFLSTALPLVLAAQSASATPWNEASKPECLLRFALVSFGLLEELISEQCLSRAVSHFSVSLPPTSLASKLKLVWF